MAHCPNGHGEQNGKFCDECGERLVSNPPPAGDSLRQRSSEARSRSDSNTTVNVNPGQRDSVLLPLLLVLLLAALAALVWLLFTRNAAPSGDPVAGAVVATLTAQATPVAPASPPDGTATAALATAQAVAQAPAEAAPPAEATPTADSGATAQAIDARVQERVDALLATRDAAQPTATGTGAPPPTETPNVDATVQAQVAAALTAQPTPTETPLPTASPDVDATVQARVAAALASQPTATATPVPSATPNSAATYEAAVLATLTAVARSQPTATATPNVNATLLASIASTVTAVARTHPAAMPTPNLNATVNARIAATQTARPTATRNATATAAVATAWAVGRQSAPASSTPQVGDTWTNPVDGAVYVYVPAGQFFMGRSNGDDDERPLHWIRLDGFWVMRTEVTNAQYRECMRLNKCPATINQRAYESAFVEHPVVSISWAGADAYARWAGGRLPTEAEWEKACRGASQYIWPWGNGDPNRGLANFNNNVRDTTPVGSLAAGASPYGAVDMAGNVMEWVADWYATDYYAKSSSHNPTGPEEGTMRVLRGGSYGNTSDGIRCTYRNRNLPTARLNTIGFRVVIPYP